MSKSVKKDLMIIIIINRKKISSNEINSLLEMNKYYSQYPKWSTVCHTIFQDVSEIVESRRHRIQLRGSLFADSRKNVPYHQIYRSHFKINWDHNN